MKDWRGSVKIWVLLTRMQCLERMTKNGRSVLYRLNEGSNFRTNISKLIFPGFVAIISLILVLVFHVAALHAPPVSPATTVGPTLTSPAAPVTSAVMLVPLLVIILPFFHSIILNLLN